MKPTYEELETELAKMHHLLKLALERIAVLEEKLNKNSKNSGRGRDAGFPTPPAQIRTCRVTAYGSYLGCWRKSALQDKGVISGHGESIAQQFY